jgi:hypothetical protein
MNFQPKIMNLIIQKGDGLTSIQHFGTILILVRLYGNGTIQRITLTLTLLIHLKRYSKVVVELLHLRHAKFEEPKYQHQNQQKHTD